MKKGKKLFIFVLIVTVFLVPMLTSCEPEPEVDHVAEAKAAFFKDLKELADEETAEIKITVTEATIVVEVKDGANADNVLDIANTIITELKGLTKSGTKLTFEGEPADEYKLHTGGDIDLLKVKLKGLFEGKQNVSKSYTASIVNYQGQSFTFNGTLKVTDNRQ